MEFFHDHIPVGQFKRSYGSNEEIYDWTQYVTTLCRKPGAIEHTRFFRQMPDGWQSFLSQSQGKERKSALQLLYEIVSDGNGNCARTRWLWPERTGVPMQTASASATT